MPDVLGRAYTGSAFTGRIKTTGHPASQRWLAVCVFPLMLAACAGPAPVFKGQAAGAPMGASELAQSDVNRVVTLAMRDNLDSLIRLADKLYRRNPAEWRKSGLSSREDALARLRSSIHNRLPLPELQAKRDIQALALVLTPEFAGDRVAGFISASADMLITAHGGSITLYLTDSLDAQAIYNAARNMEIAAWILASRRNSAGQLLLLADEMAGNERNLSFEREFGKVIGRLDLVAMVLTEKYRRAVITYVQSFAGASFLQFLPVR
ncbi:MAG: putative lipoprotein [Polaromonas sp.]|nr:putative lipoprotein [Polaromonas sp.]